MSDRLLQVATAIDAEKSVLGALILRPELIHAIDCRVNYFFDSRHMAIFSALSDMAEEGIAADTVTLEVQLKKAGKLEAVGHLAYIAELAGFVPTADNVEHYARIVRDHWVTRQTVKALASVKARILNGEVLGTEAADEAVATLSRVDRPEAAVAHRTGELGLATFERIRAAMAAKDQGEEIFAGVPSGVSELNALTGGYPVSVLTVIGGLPGSGKSTFSINEADYAAHKGYGAHICTYEDRAETYGLRLLAREANISAEKLRALELDMNDRATLRQAAQRLAQRPSFLVEHMQGVKVDELVRRVRGRARDNKTRIVFVDYIQNMPAPAPRMKKHDAIEANLEALEILAGQDDLAVVVFSQLNAPTREGFKKWTPSAMEFFGGRVIHHKAKLMIGLKYPHDHDAERSASELELHVLKNHQGQTGVLDAHYNRSRGLIRGTA